MGKLYDSLDDALVAFIQAQHVFFVATSPLSGDGRVNVSPKGMAGTFAVLGPNRVAYLDYHGSGVETIAHLREPGNGRICVMFCAFEGRPTIVRLHGTGRFVRAEDAEFAKLRAAFDKDRTVGQRSIVVVDVERVSDSCGWSVPVLDFVEDRTILDQHQLKKGAESYADFGETANARSIDGLPALTRQA